MDTVDSYILRMSQVAAMLHYGEMQILENLTKRVLTKEKLDRQLNALTHIMRICCNFDITNLQRYHAGFAPMLFQWSNSHMACFSSQIHYDFFAVQFFRSRPLFIV